MKEGVVFAAAVGSESLPAGGGSWTLLGNSRSPSTGHTTPQESSEVTRYLGCCCPSNPVDALLVRLSNLPYLIHLISLFAV